MSFPALSVVVALGEDLLQPLHDSRKHLAIRRLDIKCKPVIGNTKPPNIEDKPFFRLPENPVKQDQRLRAQEQGFPVIKTGADFVPHPLSE
jgi:hypothetical protein